MLKNTLETSDLVRENINFNIDKHQLQTACVNKIALKANGDKSFIRSDLKTTLLYGPLLLRNEYITKQNIRRDWLGYGNEGILKFVRLPEAVEASGWEKLDPGFRQPSYSNEGWNDVVDLSDISAAVTVLLLQTLANEKKENCYCKQKSVQWRRSFVSRNSDNDWIDVLVFWIIQSQKIYIRVTKNKILLMNLISKFSKFNVFKIFKSESLK